MAVAVSSDNQHWLLCIGRNFLSHLLLVSSAVTYLAGLWIERDRKQEKTYIRENAGQFASRQEKKEFKQKGEKRRRNLMVSALLILLAVLGVFKYADFVIDNMNAVFMRLEVIGSWNIWIYCFQWEFPFIHFSRWDICWMYTGKNRCTEEFFQTSAVCVIFSTTGTGTDQPLFRFITDVV